MKPKPRGRARDISGQHFNKLTALYPTLKRQYGYVVWHCRCDCGNEKDVALNCLIQGHTGTCGCGQRRRVIRR